jgi:hypothetical protein
MSLIIISYKVHDSQRVGVWVVCFNPPLVHLVVRLLDDLGDERPNCKLLLYSQLEVLESGLSWLKLVVFENIKVSILILLFNIVLVLLVLGADEFLQELDFPKLWELL